MSAAVPLAVLLPAVPGVAGLAGLVVPLRMRALAAVLGVGSTAVALVAAVALAVTVPRGEFAEARTTLVDFGNLPVTVGVRVDTIAALVAIAVGVVACAVQVYSISYLADERAGDGRFTPYAAQVSIFTAAMLNVVVAGDLVQLLVGWEVMGICSYLLIGHDRRLPEAPAAAVKAFLVTRIGDVGFWLGIVLLGTGAGSFRIADVTAAVTDSQLSPARLTTACLLLLAGVAGKSAQFPLHTWLPDAMAGPTPISALIHAATMVAAGVYVVARLYPIFLAAPGALPTLGVMAAVTMLLGALAATAQDDIKRVLAWSTVSQIAYMAGGLAVGAGYPALFHLLTHAAFKALLFLGAGVVIHAVGTNLMSRMGGLRPSLPVTFWCMTIGLAALAGVPPFAGFWSKESILGAALGAADGTTGSARWTGWLVLVAGLVTAGVTGWYATRLWLRTFFGPSRSDQVPHGPPAAMRWPVVLLAVPAALLGLIALLPGVSSETGWFAYLPAGQTATAAPPNYGAGVTIELGTSLVALLVTAVGVSGAWLAWRRDPAADPARYLGAARPVFGRAFYLDDVQDALVVRPVRAIARAVRAGDERIVDGAVEGAGVGTVGLGRLLARVHAAGIPRYTGAVLAGAILVGVAAVMTGVLR